MYVCYFDFIMLECIVFSVIVSLGLGRRTIIEENKKLCGKMSHCEPMQSSVIAGFYEEPYIAIYSASPCI